MKISGLTGRNFEFLQGYHAAMNDVAQKCLAETKAAQERHDQARANFWGGPSKQHFLELGMGRQAKAISDFAFSAGQIAFAARRATP